MISLETLSKDLDKCAASGKVLLVDACRNSPKSNLAAGIEGDKAKVPASVFALFSCSSGERSLEHKDLQRGIFFHQVLEGFKGKAGDGNDAITFASLARHVCNEVPNQSLKLTKHAKQTPIASVKEDKASSLILAQHPEAIPVKEWKEYLDVWSKGGTKPFLEKYGPKRFAYWRQ